MHETFKIKDGMLICSKDEIEIIHYFNLTDQEKMDIMANYNIDEHTITSCLDVEEVPRFEQDENNINIIVKIPTSFTVTNSQAFNVKSVGIFLRNNMVIIIGNENTDYLSSKVNFKIRSRHDLILHYFNAIIKHFMEHLRTIRLLSKKLQTEINKSMDNESLLLMFDLSEILVYYLDSIENNKFVLKKYILKVQKEIESFNKEFAEDVHNEFEQAKKQAEIYSQVFAGLMDARGTIINNNMNILIKNLTIINIVFLPLNLIASMGGMSEFSSFTNKIPWPVSYGIFTLAMFFIGFISMLIINRSTRKMTKKKSNNRFNLTPRSGSETG